MKREEKRRPRQRPMLVSRFGLRGTFRVEHYDKNGKLKGIYYASTDDLRKLKDGNDKRRAESRA